MKLFKRELLIIWTFIGLVIEQAMAQIGVIMSANAYSSTVLQNVRAFITDPVNKFELRTQSYGGISAFLKRRDYTIPRLEEIRQSENQTAQAMFMKSKAYTVGSARSCTPSGETSGSSKVDLSWSTVSDASEWPFEVFGNNEVSMMKAMANDFYNMEKSLLDQLETNIIAYCEASKTGVNAISAVTSTNTWVGGGVDTVQVASANINRFYNLARADMLTNKYKQEIMEIHDPQWTAEQSYYQAQGMANSANTAFQFEGFDSYTSHAIAPTGYNKHLHYLIPTNGVAMIDWTRPLNRKRERSNDGRIWTIYQSLFFPGLTFMLFEKSTCGDSTSSGGTTQDLVTTMELSLDYSLVKAPLTTANETPIFKYSVI